MSLCVNVKIKPISYKYFYMEYFWNLIYWVIWTMVLIQSHMLDIHVSYLAI